MSEKPKITADVQRLIDMDDEMICAKDIAPIVHMNQDVIIRYAKTGQWDLCRYVISGNRVKFFRKDFLVKCGFMDPDPEPADVERAVLTAVIDALQTMLESQKETIRLLTEQNELLRRRMA